MAPPNSKQSNFQGAGKTLKRKADDDDDGGRQPNRPNKRERRTARSQAYAGQPDSAVTKGKSNKLNLKQPNSQQQGGGGRAKHAVKLGNYDVVAPHDQAYYDRMNDRSRPSHDRPNDRRRSDRSSRGDDFQSNGHSRPINLRVSSDKAPDRGQLWRIDLKGDDDNVKYGRINKWEVPKYRLTAGQGSIIGLDPAIKIDRSLTTDTYYVLKYPPKVARARFEAVVDEEGEADVTKEDDCEEDDVEHEDEDEVERSFQEVNYGTPIIL